MSKNRSVARLVPLAVFLVLEVAVAVPAVAAPGDLDPAFGTGGKVTTPFPPGLFTRARAGARQPDGKVVAVGLTTVAVGDDFALARYNRDGTLDATFGTGGKVTTDFLGSFDHANAVVVQPDGKIIAAGSAFSGSLPGQINFALARYERNGTLDTTFGTGGKVVTEVDAGFDGINAVVLQPNGKIIAAGSAKRGQLAFTLARYERNGTLDATFGTGGTAITAFAGSSTANALVLQPNGKVIAAGTASTGLAMGNDFALARYNRDGTLDATFGIDGKVTTDFAHRFDNVHAVVLKPNGKIIAAGIAFAGSSDDFALARYKASGTLDSTFGTGGKVTTDFAGSTDSAHAVVLKPNGKIIAVGAAFTGSGDDFALARYKASGTLDSTFGTGGKVTTDFAGHTDSANAVVLEPNGKIIAVGAAFTGSSDDFALARYLGRRGRR